MIDANKVFRSLYKIRFTDLVNHHTMSYDKKVDKLRKHRLLNSKINGYQLSGIIFYNKFYKKVSYNRLSPSIVDDRKFSIHCYTNYSNNTLNKSLTMISITESTVYIETNQDVLVDCADGLDDDEMFNAKVSFNVPDIVSKSEVLKIRQLIKQNKNYRCKKFILFFDENDVLIIPYYVRTSRLSKL